MKSEEIILNVAMSAFNYIFISAISNRNQQQTVQDFKTVLTYLMDELKSGQQKLMEGIERNRDDILSEIKEKSE